MNEEYSYGSSKKGSRAAHSPLRHIWCYVGRFIRQPCCLVAWSDFFFAGIPILGCFFGSTSKSGIYGIFFFSFFLSCPPFQEKENPVNPGLSG